jgi:DNA-directed RNA polymerase specialized sigma24 family protein
VLESPGNVIFALLRYTDWWQPSTSSILQVGAARRARDLTDGLPTALLSTLDERSELARRMQLLEPDDRTVLFLWYVRQLSAMDIAREVKVSRRQVFRRRARAVRRIVELGEPREAA